MIIAPPLVITRVQVDELFGLIRQALDRTCEEARAGGWLTPRAATPTGHPPAAA